MVPRGITTQQLRRDAGQGKPALAEMQQAARPCQARQLRPELQFVAGQLDLPQHGRTLQVQQRQVQLDLARRHPGGPGLHQQPAQHRIQRELLINPRSTSSSGQPVQLQAGSGRWLRAPCPECGPRRA